MRQCLVCGTDLDPEWTQCESCETPVPDPTRPVMATLPQSGPLATSRSALWAAALVVMGFCIPFAPLVAIPVGLSAVREIDESEGRLAGRGLAKVGVIGGGLFGGLQLLFMLAALVPLLFGGPDLLVGITGGGEELGLGALKKLYKAESMARFSVAVDADGDGLGEFCEMEKLVAGHMPYLRKDLGDGNVGGYWLLIVLPEGTDQREQEWWGIAQPQFARKGWRTFVVNSRGVIHARNTEGAEPDLNALDEWDAIDMVMSRYDEEVLAAQAAATQMQMQQRQRQQQMRAYEEQAYQY